MNGASGTSGQTGLPNPDGRVARLDDRRSNLATLPQGEGDASESSAHVATYCHDGDPPNNGRKGAKWKDVLPSGETNPVVCNHGYELSNGSANTCVNGLLTRAICTRRPNWTFREMENCYYPHGSEVAIAMSETTDRNQRVKDCKAECVKRQCNSAVIPQHARMCYLKFGKPNSSTPIDEQMVCSRQSEHSSWILGPSAPKVCPPTTGNRPCQDITPPTNGANGPDCPSRVQNGSTCTQFCNPGFVPVGDSTLGRCVDGEFTPIQCTANPQLARTSRTTDDRESCLGAVGSALRKAP